MKPSFHDHDVLVHLSLEGMHDEALFMLVMTLQPLFGVTELLHDDDDLLWYLACYGTH